MVKTISLFVVAAIACSTMAAVPLRDSAAPSAQIIPYMDYYFAEARGYFQGIYIGLYKDTTYTVSTLCLGNDTITNIAALYDDYMQGASISIFSAIGQLYSVLYEFNQYCP
jgi:hypothetical protein